MSDHLEDLRVERVKNFSRYFSPGIENLDFLGDFRWVEHHPSDFWGPQNFRKFFCTKGTTLLFFVFLSDFDPKMRPRIFCARC